MCLHPMHRFPIPGTKHPTTGNPVAIFRPVSDTTVPYGNKVLTEYQVVPCGNCKECKMQYAKDWAIRAAAEASLYPEDYNYVLTLTYDNNNLPVTDWTDPITGEYIDTLPTLLKKDLQEFMRKLRRYFDYHYAHTGIRFLGSGEYGPKEGRPHYHLCLFNCPIHWLPGFDPEPFDYSELGNPQYLCYQLSKIWNKGLITFAPFTPESAAYVARYTLKKAGLCGEGFKSILKSRAKKDARYREYYRQCIDWDFKRKGFEFKLDNLKKMLKDNPSLEDTYKDDIEYYQDMIASYTVPRPQKQENEFTVVSKKPGLGYGYFQKYWQDIYQTDEIFVTKKKNKPPKYFDGLLEVLDKDLMEKVKSQRQTKGQLLRTLQEETFDIDDWRSVYELKESYFDDIAEIYKRKDL